MKIIYIFLLVFILSAFCNNDKKVRIFLIGDSTMANKPKLKDPERGWGQLFPNYFDGSVTILNHAVNGRSTKNFISQGRWNKVLEQLQPNDWVFIQFGHNDENRKDTSRYAAPQTTYRQNLIRFVEETRRKGAKPVLLTPVARRKFNDNGNLIDTHGQYPRVVKEVGANLKVPVIDVHQKSKDLLVKQGAENSKKLFLWFEKGVYPSRPNGVSDNTHFSEYGAAMMAALVAEGIREQKLDLVTYLKKIEAGEFAN